VHVPQTPNRNVLAGTWGRLGVPIADARDGAQRFESASSTLFNRIGRHPRKIAILDLTSVLGIADIGFVEDAAKLDNENRAARLTGSSPANSMSGRRVALSGDGE